MWGGGVFDGFAEVDRRGLGQAAPLDARTGGSGLGFRVQGSGFRV